MRRGRVWLSLVAALVVVPLLLWTYAPQLWPARFPPRTPPKEPPPGRPFVKTPVTWTGPPATEQSLRAAARDTNVFICVLDAARVDHFGAYGYPRPTTPNFDRLAAEAVLFDQHFSIAPQTRPATMSLLTGLYPDAHGMVDNFSGAAPPDSVTTLESVFSRAGYATYLLYSNPEASPTFGVGRDFEHQQQIRDVEVAGKWLREQVHDLTSSGKGHGERFFAYMHVFPPHAPYTPPAQYRQGLDGRPPRYWRRSWGPDASWREWVNSYDANLRWADAFVGEVARVLQEAGQLERTLLIVTADHGEGLREHGQAAHLTCPYDEALHIPLLVRFPGEPKPAGRVHALTQTIDLFPTLVDLYGLPAPRVEGASLLPLLSGETQEANRYLVSRVGTRRISYVIRDARWNLFVDPGGGRRLFDMDADPWQVHDVYARPRPEAAELERAFAAFTAQQRTWAARFARGRARPGASGTLTSAQRRALKSLGYVK